MNILGIVTKTHDSGLALLSDGIPALVFEEERFNRQKHTLLFPSLSLAAAFDGERHQFGDIDVITTPWNMKHLRWTGFSTIMGGLPQSLNLLRPAAHRGQGAAIVNLPMRLWLGLGRRFGFSKIPKIIQVGHHDAHAATYFVSPFEEATVLVMDGYGDDTATSAYTARSNRLKCEWKDEFFDSLGMLYTCVTEHLGFKFFEEGTVMALAAYGGPTYVKQFQELIELRPEGRIAIDKSFVSYNTHGFCKPFKKNFSDTFGPARQRYEPITDRHRDLAFALQVTVEEAILHIVRELRRRYPSRNLCISGGVALNSVANARILRDTDYQSVWVPPCASDTGAALGSALWHYHQTLGRPRRFTMLHPFYGKAYGDAEMMSALEQAGLQYKRMMEADLLRQVARDLAQGKIVGWFQGRSEIGPRALGNRSILADARNPAMKDRINARVKHREPFRPFAPAVLEERLTEFFEFDRPDPFMMMAPKVRPDKAPLIPAAVHVDGTARIQTVDRAVNPRFYGVIDEFARLTGIPVILNTSFNHREPIVLRPEDAISCYLRTEMDVLVLGDFYITDRDQDAARRARETFPARSS